MLLIHVFHYRPLYQVNMFNDKTQITNQPITWQQQIPGEFKMSKEVLSNLFFYELPTNWGFNAHPFLQ